VRDPAVVTEQADGALDRANVWEDAATMRSPDFELDVCSLLG
jgi:hypothetical protein